MTDQEEVELGYRREKESGVTVLFYPGSSNGSSHESTSGTHEI
jgi:hypothetical protein